MPENLSTLTSVVLNKKKTLLDDCRSQPGKKYSNRTILTHKHLLRVQTTHELFSTSLNTISFMRNNKFLMNTSVYLLKKLD